MTAKRPNKILTPLVIVGITVGFLGAAYKFIFVDSKRTEKEQPEKLDRQDSQKDTTETS